MFKVSYAGGVAEFDTRVEAVEFAADILELFGDTVVVED